MINVSPNGNTRFFSTSIMQTDDTLKDAINDQAMFFEFDVLLEKEGENGTYVEVKASNIDSLKKINNYVTYQDSLLDDQMIVTKSLADDFQLSIGDEVFIHINESQKTFNIVEIVEDDMLFTGHQVFIDKTEALPFFLNALSHKLARLNTALLTNIYNKVYVDIHENYEISEVISLFQSKEAYQSLTFEVTMDELAINQFIQRNITAFFMIILISIFAIAFVLKTTLEVYFHEKQQLYATIHILGGKKRFSMMIVIMEMIVFFIIAFLLAILFSQVIINFGLTYLSSNLIYHIEKTNIIYALLISFI